MATQKETPQQACSVVKTKQFEKDLRRLAHSGRYQLSKLQEVVTLLKMGISLPSRYNNHALHGEFAACEECHIAGDWLLVYQRRKQMLILVLVRTGTHSDLFGG